MAVLSAHSFALEVPDLAGGVEFYRNAGFVFKEDGARARASCPGQDRESILLIGGASRKRLHHVALRADPAGFHDIREKVGRFGGSIVEAPEGFERSDLWVRDPHGMLIRLVDAPADAPLAAVEPFSINQPGQVNRVRRSAMRPRAVTAVPRPLRLGHILVFTPDVPASVDFVTNVLGMGLADHAQDVIAFCCARRNSDHHVLAFAKSPGVGFHHGSFEVCDPDEVGRAGEALAAISGRGQWGFGRHTIGSNFFQYIQDPWGSWFEYYSDMDYIEDHALWTATNYEMEDSLANWGPKLPQDFVHNYEVDTAVFPEIAHAQV